MSKRNLYNPFLVKVEKWGEKGDPMTMLGDKKAYIKRTPTLRPEIGEYWWVVKRYQDEDIILLQPLHKDIPPVQEEI